MVDFGSDRNHPHLGRGFAYVEFSNPDEAETAMKHMDGGQIDGQEITAAPVLNIRPRPQMMRQRSPPMPQRRRRGWSPRGRSPYNRRRSPLPRPRRSPPPPRRRRYERSSSSSSR